MTDLTRLAVLASGVLWTLLTTIVWWGVRRLVTTQDRILDELRTLNGRVSRLETALAEHTAHDDERFRALGQQVRDLWLARPRARE